MGLSQPPVERSRSWSGGTTGDLPAATGHASPPRPRFRSDIEGLRAVAVLLVLLYHAGVPFLAGGFVGVDVFFVISGFLITGLLQREMEVRGRVDLPRFYARRIRRLLPASAVTLGAVAVLTLVFLPMIRWATTARDIAASAVYVANWRFAAQSVDYLSSEEAASPVLHFWSLAIEEQFYLVWPALLLGLTWWHRRRGRALTRPLLVGLAVIGLPSLVWSWHLTSVAPAEAYFASTTRAWELALGGGLAVAAPALRRLPGRLGAPLSVLGMIAVVFAATTYHPSVPFPGLSASIPTLGTALVIVGGTIRPDGGMVWRSLSIPPMQWVGSLSYSLYLWHWPLLVAALAVRPSLGAWGGVTVVALAALPSWLTHRYVENPIRRMSTFTVRPVRAVGLAAGCTVVAVVAAGVLAASVPERSVEGDTAAPGAAVLRSEPQAVAVIRGPMTPDPLDARADVPSVYRMGCHQTQNGTEPLPCISGDVDSPRTMAIVGDSHAAQWVPALENVARRHGWRLVSYTKSACGFAGGPQLDGEGRPNHSCSAWNDRLLDELTGANPPQLVVASQSHTRDFGDGGSARLSEGESREAHGRGLAETWRELLDAGIDVVALRDTPRPEIDVPECVVEHRGALAECAVPLEKAMAGNTPQLIALDLVGGEVPIVDMTDLICPGDTCPPVVGNVLVWRDTHHLTATYAESLAPFLDEALRPLLSP